MPSSVPVPFPCTTIQRFEETNEEDHFLSKQGFSLNHRCLLISQRRNHPSHRQPGPSIQTVLVTTKNSSHPNSRMPLRCISAKLFIPISPNQIHHLSTSKHDIILLLSKYQPSFDMSSLQRAKNTEGVRNRDACRRQYYCCKGHQTARG